MPRAARRLARHRCSSPGARASLDLVEQAVRRATCSSATTPTCASRSSTTASRPGARCSSRWPPVPAGEAQRRGRRRCCDPERGPRRRRPRAARRRPHRAGRAHPRSRRRHRVHRRGRGHASRPRPVEVVDTVGAGDAFMAATAGSARRPRRASARRAPACPATRSPTRLLRGAMEVAAITCERRGANPPTRQELPPWPGWPA